MAVPAEALVDMLINPDMRMAWDNAICEVNHVLDIQQ